MGRRWSAGRNSVCGPDALHVQCCAHRWPHMLGLLPIKAMSPGLCPCVRKQERVHGFVAWSVQAQPARSHQCRSKRGTAWRNVSFRSQCGSQQLHLGLFIVPAELHIRLPCARQGRPRAWAPGGLPRGARSAAKGLIDREPAKPVCGGMGTWGRLLPRRNMRFTPRAGGAGMSPHSPSGPRLAPRLGSTAPAQGPAPVPLPRACLDGARRG